MISTELLFGVCILWWVMFVLFMGAALIYLVETIQMIYTVKKNTNTALPERSYLFIHIMPYPLIGALGITLGEIGHVPRQMYFCLCLWLLICLCAMIQDKTIQKMSWGEYMNRIINGVLELFKDIRGLLMKIEKSLSKLIARKRAVLILALITGFTVLTVITPQSSCFRWLPGIIWRRF